MSKTSISRFPVPRWLLIFLFILLIFFGAIPGYLQGKWSWQQLANIPQIHQIKNLQNTGINLSPWETKEQKKISLGGKDWSAQLLSQEGQKPVILLLRPQTYYKDHPEVEWVDIDGWERWQTDSRRQLKFNFSLEDQFGKVTARFFRAWNQRETFAVLQWYATPQGGTASAGDWFWADLRAQLNHSRLPWVAVCLKIPIEPLGDIDKAEPLALSLAQTIQNQLITRAFFPEKSKT